MLFKGNHKWPFHVAVIVFSIVSDQLTKLWAVARFTDEAGNFTYEKIPVIGELVRFQLVYNKGAAFSSRPQDLLPVLPPWLFFLLISIVAAVAVTSVSCDKAGNYAKRALDNYERDVVNPDNDNYAPDAEKKPQEFYRQLLEQFCRKYYHDWPIGHFLG